MLGLIRGAGIAIKGLGKAFKAYKRANRRQSLGLPRETNMQRMKRIKKAGQKRAERRKGTRWAIKRLGEYYGNETTEEEK